MKQPLMLQTDCLDWLEKQGEKKPAWSKNDEKNFQGIINAIKEVRCQSLLSEIEIYDDYIEWLESLKQRIGE